MARGSETPLASARRTSSSTPASNIACGALEDSPLELLARHVEAEEERRVARLALQSGSRRAERLADLRQLERADDAPAVVRVDALRCERVALGEQRMGVLRAQWS